MTDRVRISEVALRVGDGAAIDWREAMDASGGGEAQEVMRNLRLVDSIARTLRDQPVEPADEEQLRALLDGLRELPPLETAEVPARWGKLEIRGRIGAGTFADVFRAFDPALQREVALKLFRSEDPGLQKRMLEEGQRMARVNHPGVVRIYGAEEHGGRVGLWMELVSGQTLEQDPGKDHRRGAGELAVIGRELCAALAAVHQAGLVHGDVKLQNVLRDDRGRLLLADFGSGADREALHGSGRIRGTPLYLAPETLDGARASVRSDVYSLGVLLFFLASGEFPVAAESLPQLQAEHRAGHRRSLLDLRPDLPDNLAGAIERALDPDPDRRFGSMGEFARALGDAQAEGKREPSGKRRALQATSLLVAVIAAAWLLSGPFTELLRSPGPTYQLDLALHRFSESGAERLEPGARVAVGDRLALELTASTDLYVYVFNEDQRGHAHALFPLAPDGSSNPLPGGQTHWLPVGPDGNPLRWRVDSVGGVERIHVFASPRPPADFQRLFDDLPPATLAGSASGALRPRGIGMVAAPPTLDPVSAVPLAQAAAHLAGTKRETRGASYQVFELHNPGE